MYPAIPNVTILREMPRGDLCDIYEGMYRGTRAFVKVASNKADNDLVQTEARVLHWLYPPEAENKGFYQYLCKYLASGMLGDKAYIVVSLAPEYVSLCDILRAYPNGLGDFRDMAWMYRRLLDGLGFVHEMGVIHGAILPTHVLVHPTEHGAKITDWSYSLNFAALVAPKPVDPDPPKAVAPGPLRGLGVWDLVRQNLYADGGPAGGPDIPKGPPPDPNRMYVKAISVDYSKFYAPEILRKETPSPASDIYMAAKCAVALLGGDVETNVLPDSIVSPETSDDPKKVRAQIQAFLQASLLPNPHKRPQDAWQVHEDFDNLLLALVGKPTYRPFSMPGGTP